MSELRIVPRNRLPQNSSPGTDEPDECANKECVECAFPIPINAKKCTKCNTYQDLRRHLTLGAFALVSFANILILAANTYLSWQREFGKKPETLTEMSYYSFDDLPMVQIGIYNGGYLPLYIQHVNIYVIVNDRVFGHAINVEHYFQDGIRIMPQQEKMMEIENISKGKFITSGDGIKTVLNFTEEQRDAVYNSAGASVGSELITGEVECGFHISTFQDSEWPEPSVRILRRQIKCDIVGPMLLNSYESQVGSLSAG